MNCPSCEENNKKKNLFQQATNIAKGFTNLVTDNPETKELSLTRLTICYDCVHCILLVKIGNNLASKCTKCNCIVEAKSTVKEEVCPIGKW